MALSRREFLACAAGAVSVGSPRWRPVAVEQAWPACILPVDGQCSLPESVAGYQSVLAGRRRGRLMIVPAVLELPARHARMITQSANAGWTVIVECGAGFADHLTFRRHQRALREGLNIDIRDPVDLWSNPRRAPYVDYTWPGRAKVRDFSRVVPMGDQPGAIVAWADGVPVALRRQVGLGTLIVLGSPLGPALWAGDAEARRWLLSHDEQMRADAHD
jgi:hypothetical protein